MKINPSNAHIWSVCPGSVRLVEGMPKREKSASALEGIKAHEMAAAALTNGVIPEGGEEMRESVSIYIDAVRAITDSPIVEKYLYCSAIHHACGGYPDAWSHDEKERIVDIWDFKYGHRFVEVEGNPQMTCYAEAIVGNITGRTLAVDRVNFHVVQPRAYGSPPVRTWSYEPGDAIQKARVIALRAAADLATSKNPKLVVGQQCTGCEARRKCPALQKSAYNILTVEEDMFDATLTVEETARELTVLTEASVLLKARIDSLKPVVEQAIRDGASGLGWVLESGRGATVWDRPIEEVIALGEALGVKVGKTEAITPLQAIKAGLSKELVQAYSKVVAGSESLKPFKSIKEFR